MAHELYRHFDKDKNLLYVGITWSTLSRSRQHKQSAWYDEIAVITIERFATEAEARRAEAHAIATEHPRHNQTVIAPPPQNTGPWQVIVRELRDKGMTLGEIADLCDTRLTTLSDIARGATREPRAGVGKRLESLHRERCQPANKEVH